MYFKLQLAVLGYGLVLGDVGLATVAHSLVMGLVVPMASELWPGKFGRLPKSKRTAVE